MSVIAALGMQPTQLMSAECCRGVFRVFVETSYWITMGLFVNNLSISCHKAPLPEVGRCFGLLIVRYDIHMTFISCDIQANICTYVFNKNKYSSVHC